MIRSTSVLVVSILLSLYSGTASAGFILDPNKGAYSSSDVPPRPMPESLDEKIAAAKNAAELREALAEFGKYFRYNRYVFVGIGGKRGNVDQGGARGSGSGIAGTVGFDLDGLTWATPYILEARGSFGFSPPTGETAIFWYIGAPLWKGWFDRSKNVPNPLNDDLARGMPFGATVLKNREAIPEWADQYAPIKIEAGVGYQGINFEQRGGTIIDGGFPVRVTATGMIAGLAWAGRVGYFGECDMLRLTGYLLTSSQARTGGKFSDTLSGLGGDMEMDAVTKGKMIEGKLDWFHRQDEWVRTGSWLSGYGLSLIIRNIHLDQGRTIQARSILQPGVTTVFPEQNIRQVELVATIGFMR